MQEYSEALCTTKAAIVIFAGIVAVRNVRLLLVLQRALTADGALRRELLERLKAYFGALPTCNRKIAEYPHVLHKLQDWATLYAYITEIPVFRAMYADPLRKRAFLNYLVLLEKRPTEVQATLRENFELYFAIHRRWFSTSSSTAGRVAYYELNPAIYRSPKDLLYFEDVTFHISAYFEQNGERAPHPVSHAPRLADRVMWTAGEHGVAIQDLESALKVRGVMVASHCLPRARKERFRGLQPIPHWALTIVPRAQALYGVSDFLRIPAVHRQLCRFPARVARLIRRLARLYALHLQAIIHDWLAPSGDGNRPAHRVPAYLEGVNISWWTTREGPEGGARMLPLKLRVCHVLAQTLEHDPTTEPADVADVLDNSARFGHLALMIWNSGAQNFEEDTLHARFAGEALSDQQRVKMYGRSVRDPRHSHLPPWSHQPPDRSPGALAWRRARIPPPGSPRLARGCCQGQERHDGARVLPRRYQHREILPVDCRSGRSLSRSMERTSSLSMFLDKCLLLQRKYGARQKAHRYCTSCGSWYFSSEIQSL